MILLPPVGATLPNIFDILMSNVDVDPVVAADSSAGGVSPVVVVPPVDEAPPAGISSPSAAVDPPSGPNVVPEQYKTCQPWMWSKMFLE